MLELDKELIVVLRQWVQKAENDLKNATHTLKLGEDCPTDTVCFHAQQCAEKYIKALLAFHGTAFSRIHQIEALISLLPRNHRPDLTLEEQGRLTDYATSTRYPGDYERIPVAEAKQSVQIARRVLRQIRR
jgi:HEPN domain-containing protein